MLVTFACVQALPKEVPCALLTFSDEDAGLLECPHMQQQLKELREQLQRKWQQLEGPATGGCSWAVFQWAHSVRGVFCGGRGLGFGFVYGSEPLSLVCAVFLVPSGRSEVSGKRAGSDRGTYTCKEFAGSLRSSKTEDLLNDRGRCVAVRQEQMGTGLVLAHRQRFEEVMWEVV